MPIRRICLAAILFTASALAGSPPEPKSATALTSLKVDVSQVASVGSVQPVNGVTSAGQPDAEALRVFRDSGYAAVIDLRGESENRGLDEKAVVEDLGMNYVAFPLVGRSEINFDNAGRLRELIDGQDGPVLIHCGSGNRVGSHPVRRLFGAVVWGRQDG